MKYSSNSHTRNMTFLKLASVVDVCICLMGKINKIQGTSI